MPFTLVAFVETQGGGTLLNIAGLADPHVRVSGDDIYIPDELPFLLGYYTVGVYMTAARFESPSLRRLANIDVCGYDTGAEPGSPPLMHPLLSNPKTLEGSEGFNLKATISPGSYVVGLAWLSSGPVTKPTGEIFTVLATSSTTLTAYAWSNGALTFATTLPRGRYQVVGMRAKSTGLIAARLVFPGQAWRPGCIGNDADTDIEAQCFRAGEMGVWGEFDHDLPPTVDFLSVSADTAESVWLDLIKIA